MLIDSVNSIMRAIDKRGLSMYVEVTACSSIVAFLFIPVVIVAARHDVVRPEFALQHAQAQNVALKSEDDPGDLTPIISCAGCHSQRQANIVSWKNSYDVWASRDPHATAFATLLSTKSQKIVRANARNGFSSTEDILKNPRYHQVLKRKCISCHSTVQTENAARELSFSDGVNCQSCHGAAKKWKDIHAKSEEWSQHSLREKRELGFQNLDDLTVRAQICMTCHIGSAGRDVNHDLIAAGHPRLQFEYSYYLERLPKHWIEGPAFSHLKSWSIGQIQSAKSTLSLLHQRASTAAHKKAPWPEFAEYDCQNCHHSLGGSWNVPHENVQPGKISWVTWKYPDGIEPNAFGLDLGVLRNEMSKPLPRAEIVAHITADINAVAENKSPIEHIYSVVRSDPRLNSDDVFAWYFAVNSCLHDFFADQPLRDNLIGLMVELKTLLNQPLATSNERQEVNSEQILEIMSHIRQIVLPVLEQHPNTVNQQP